MAAKARVIPVNNERNDSISGFKTKVFYVR
jgi:hypothetical protein